MKISARKFFILFFVFALQITLYTLHSYAAVPHLINYQGRLTDTAGVPLNGTYTLTFRIYDAETAGSLLWQGTYSVSIQKGIFAVLLGDMNDAGYNFSSLAFDKAYFLEIKVGAEVMSPRQRIASVGYAIRAEMSETAETAKMAEMAKNAEGVKGITNYFPGSGNVGIGTTNPASKLDVNGDITLSSSNPIINQTAAGGALILKTTTNSYIRFDTNGANARMTIDSAGNVGIGTTNPTQKLDIQGGQVKIKGIVIDHVTGSNPGCLAGGIVIRKWVSKICNGNAWPTRTCTTASGWSIVAPSCCIPEADSQVCCSADTWTEAICMGN